MRARRFLCVIMLALLAVPPLRAADDEPEPYSEDEFPQWARDTRRLEIITLGSLPFTTLCASLLYSAWRTDDFISTNKNVRVFSTAAALSVGAGVSDLIITLLIRRSKERRLQRQREQGGLVVQPLGPEQERQGPPQEWLHIEDLAPPEQVQEEQ